MKCKPGYHHVKNIKELAKMAQNIWLRNIVERIQSLNKNFCIDQT